MKRAICLFFILEIYVFAIGGEKLTLCRRLEDGKPGKALLRATAGEIQGFVKELDQGNRVATISKYMLDENEPMKVAELLLAVREEEKFSELLTQVISNVGPDSRDGMGYKALVYLLQNRQQQIGNEGGDIPLENLFLKVKPPGGIANGQTLFQQFNLIKGTGCVSGAETSGLYRRNGTKVPSPGAGKTHF